MLLYLYNENPFSMANKDLEHLISLSNCFYYSSNYLPISIVTKKKTIFSLPEKIVSAKTILGLEKNFIEMNTEEHFVHTIENKYKEIFFCICISKYQVIIGPFLSKKVETGQLTNMIRNNLIPFHQKAVLLDYYNSCKILDDKQIFYTAKLIQHMFTIDSNITFDESKIINIDLEKNSFINKKNEYRHNYFLHSPYSTEQEISKAISNGDIAKTKEILKEINIQPHAKLASNQIRSYKNSMICSCSFMTRAAISGGVNSDDAFTLSDTYIMKIENMQSLNELESFEPLMAEGFAKLVNTVKSKNYSPAVVSTIYYIDNHLCENLSIDDLAKVAYLNPSYLSTLFHKETGKTISDWIMNKRIEEAAIFILNTNISISEISFMYKFCSQSYFVQCFKKIMGTTPGEYKKNKLKKSAV